MSVVVMKKNDDIIMRLVHYFITECDYSPIIVNGVKDEIWLENTEGPYKIIRINSNYIHNNEQFQFDIFKTKNVMKQIKKKTLSFRMNALNIFLDLNENVNVSFEKNIDNIKIDSLDDIKNEKIIKNSFPDLNEKMLDKMEGMDLILNVTKDINKKNEEKNISYEKTFKPKKIIVTNILISICSILFLITWFIGKRNIFQNIPSTVLYLFGANFAPIIKYNIVNVYRFVACMFLHLNLMHLIFNMYALFILGTQVETFLGKRKFITIYLLSGITGSMLSACFSNTLSVGASGAIFGLMGSLLYFGYHYRLYIGNAIKNQIVPIIIFNIILGILYYPSIDMAAHLGGLIGGYLATMMVGVNEKSKTSERINGSVVLILLWAFLLYIIMFIK